MTKIIGIDLGTTNSCVAVMEGGNFTIIPNSDGSRTTPSVVNIKSNGEIIVGEIAKRQAITEPEATVASIKTHMGENYKVNIHGKEYTPQEISAMILKKLKKDAEAYLGETVTEAVITVPAYFTDAQRQATKDAGEIAGLKVDRIINEPTAAALCYGLDKKKEEKVLVFDLGGGTFDVSVLEIGEGVVEVISTAGNNHLGGDDFDQKIIDWLAEEFKKETGIDLRNDKMAVQRLKDAAEVAKKTLSSSLETSISLPFITMDANGPKHLEKRLTRAAFNELTKDLVEATKEPVYEALEKAKLQVNQINEVTPLSLGIETLGGVFTPMIEKNTTIPVRKSQVYSTAADNQPAVTIRVFQGERPKAVDNHLLGEFNLEGIPAAPRGIPQIEVTFDIDANGIVHVSAKDLGTGKENTVTISGSSNLSKEEIEKMKKEAEEHEKEDAKFKELVDLRNRADSLILNVEKTIKDYGDSFENNEKEEMEKAVSELKEAKDKEDAQKIEEQIKKLSDVSAKFAERIYSKVKQNPNESGEKTTAEASDKKEDNVEEAEIIN